MDITEEDLGGAAIHSQKSGVAHFRCPSEKDCYEKVRKLLDYIPHYYGEEIVAEAKFKFDERKLCRRQVEKKGRTKCPTQPRRPDRISMFVSCSVLPFMLH